MKRIISYILILLILIVPVTGTIHAEDQTCTDGSCDPKKDETVEENLPTTTAPFITEAILSLDEKVRAYELKKDYNVNFFHSSETASTKSLDLFNPSTIVIEFFKLITTIIETIGIACTFVMLVIYNFTSSSFMDNTLNEVITKIDKVIFQWDDPNSWIVKLIIMAGILTVLYRLLTRFKKYRSPSQLILMFVEVTISCIFIFIIGQYGRTIVTTVENAVSSMIVETLDLSDGSTDPMEVQNKELMFDLLQKQPFMLRHYGTVNYKDIADTSVLNKGDIDVAKVRVQALLSNPSKEQAKGEVAAGNKFISQSVNTQIQILFLSIMMLVHRVLLIMVLGIMCIFVGVIRLIKDLLLWLAVFQLIFMAWKRDNAAVKWFGDRLQWSFVAILANLLFTLLLYFMFNICSSIASIHVSLLIVFDILILVLMKLLWVNKDRIIEAMKSDMKDIGTSMIMGRTTPAEIAANLSNKHKRSLANKLNSNESDDDITKLNDDLDEELADSYEDCSNGEASSESSACETNAGYVFGDDDLVDSVSENENVTQPSLIDSNEKESNEVNTNQGIDTNTINEVAEINEDNNEKNGDDIVENVHSGKPNVDGCNKNEIIENEIPEDEILEEQIRNDEIHEEEILEADCLKEELYNPVSNNVVAETYKKEIVNETEERVKNEHEENEQHNLNKELTIDCDPSSSEDSLEDDGQLDEFDDSEFYNIEF